jgi:outer membrane immunogenic protein
MRKLIVMGIAGCSGLTVSAQAADLGVEDVPAIYRSAHVWAGIYAGGSVGYGRGNATHTFTTEFSDGFPDVSLSGEDDIKGAIYGGHIGYNWQSGQVVAGIEAGINGTDMDGTTLIDAVDTTADTDLNWYAAAVARLGYARGNWLLYGFGGVAWGDVDTSTTDLGGGSFGSGSSDHVGWTAGVGVEYAVSERFSVRVEYSHVDLGEESLASITETGETSSFTQTNKVDLAFDAVKVGASYKLLGGDHGLESLK